MRSAAGQSGVEAAVGGDSAAPGMTRLTESTPLSPVPTYGSDLLVGDDEVALTANQTATAATDLLESGNRVNLGSGLVGKTRISSLSKTNAPQADPVIDWNGKVSGGAGTNNASWMEDFANGVNNNFGANSKMRIKL